VHEGPQRITNKPDKVALAPGMILSNEPGCYLPGEFGVRIENLVLVVPADKPGFLCFETLTRVPYDTALMDDALLTVQEREQILKYHESTII
jgi:Xaa-Pro aminopeptidase